MSDAVTGSINDFWLSSGHLLVDHNEHGLLVANDDFLKLYLARQELVPPPEACDAERDLHARLLAEPRAPVEAATVAKIADADARENWRVMLAFRDHLIAHPSLESAYLALMRQGVGETPPLFINQLVHVITRNVVDGENDPMVLRAAELLFRAQRLTREHGGILLADEELVDGAKTDMHASPLIAMLGEQKARNLDILSETNSDDYFKRSDAFDMVLDFRAGGPGRKALARVMERWITHMIGHVAKITPLDRVEDENWFWFVGLDAEGTKIGNALWKGKDPGAGAMERIVALYALDLPDVAEIAARPIYLILGMTPGQLIRFKPQNLLVGLPIGATGGGNG